MHPYLVDKQPDPPPHENIYFEVVERGDGSYDSTSLFLYIRQLL